MPDLWKNNKIQFARLLAEIRVFGLSKKQYKDLTLSMDLTEIEIDELFERAEVDFQRIKENL